MIPYPAFDPVAFSIGPFLASARSGSTGTESCTSSGSSPGGGWAAGARATRVHLETQRRR